jgi:hypothetical protein
MVENPLNPTQEEEEELERGLSYSQFAEKVRDGVTNDASQGNLTPTYARRWLEMSDKQVVDAYIKQHPDTKDLLYEPDFTQVIPGSAALGADNPGWDQFRTSSLESMPAWISANADKVGLVDEEANAQFQQDVKDKMDTLDSNPEVQAYREWMSNTGVTEDILSINGTKRLMSVINNVAYSLLSMASGGWAGSKAGFLVGGPKGAAIGGTVGSLTSLYGIVGAAGNADAISELTREKNISRNQFLDDIESYKKELTQSNTPVLERDAMIQEFISNNYTQKEDGIYEKGLNPEEASDTAFLANFLSATGEAVLEKLTLGQTKKLFGFGNNALKRNFDLNLYGKTVENIKKQVKKLPKPKEEGILNRFWDGVDQNGKVLSIGTYALAEGLQEIGQEYNNALQKTVGPGAYSDARLGDIFTQAEALEAFIGGAGTSLSVSGTSALVKRIKRPFDNYNAKESKDGVNYYTELNNNTGLYEVYVNDNGVKTRIEDKDIVNSKGQNKATFQTKSQAFKAVKDLEKQHTKLQKQLMVEEFGNYGPNAKVKVTKAEGAEFFTIDIVDGDKVLQTVGVASNQSDANQLSSNVKRTLNTTNQIIKNDKITVESLKEDKDFQNAKEDETKRNIATRRANAIVAIRTYMGEPIREGTNDDDIRIDIEKKLAESDPDNPKSINTYPELIPALIDIHGPEIIQEAGISQDALIEEYQNSYPTEVEQLENLKTLLRPPAPETGPPKQSTPTSSQGPPVQEGPDGIDVSGAPTGKPKGLSIQGKLLSDIKKLPANEIQSMIDKQVEINKKTPSPDGKIALAGLNKALKESSGPKDIDTPEEAAKKEVFKGDIITIPGHLKSPASNSMLVPNKSYSMTRERAEQHLERLIEYRDSGGAVSQGATKAVNSEINAFEQALKEEAPTSSKGLNIKYFEKTDETTPAERRLNLDKFGDVVLDVNNKIEDEVSRVNSTLDAIILANKTEATIYPIPNRADDTSSVESAVLKINNLIRQASFGNKVNMSEVLDNTILKRLDIADDKAELLRKLNIVQKILDKQTLKQKQLADNKAKAADEIKLKQSVQHLTNRLKNTGLIPFKVKYVNDETLDYRGEFDAKTDTITINLAKATADTPFHEFSHPLFNSMLLHDPQLFNMLYNEMLITDEGKSIVKEKEGQGYEGVDLQLEALSEALGRLSEGKYNKKDSIYNTIKSFINWIKEKLFGYKWDTIPIHTRLDKKNLTLGDIADIMGDVNANYVVELKPVTEEQLAEKLLAPLVPFKQLDLSDRKVVTKLNEVWNQILNQTIEFYKEDKGMNTIDFPTFKNSILRKLPSEFRPSFAQWAEERFRNDSYVQKMELQSSKLEEFDTYVNQAPYINKVEKLWEGIEEGGPEESSLDQKLVQEDDWYWKELAVNIPAVNKNALMKEMRTRIKSFDQFVDTAFGNKLYIPTPFNSLSSRQKRIVKQFYNNIKSSVPTNRSKTSNFSFRKNYQMFMDFVLSKSGDGQWVKKIARTTVSIKGPESNIPKKVSRKQSNKRGAANTYYNRRKESNQQFDKKMALELPGVSWISKANSWQSTSFQNTRPDEVLVYENRYSWVLPTIQELNQDYEVLNDLEAQFNKEDKAILMSKGDSQQIAVIDINKLHKTMAKDVDLFEGLWESQYEAKNIDEATLAKYKNMPIEQRAKAVAIHMTMESIFPGYLKLDAKTIVKRIKIPFTPATFSDSMESFNVRKIDASTFSVSMGDGQKISMSRTIELMGKKNVSDGASITSRSFFEKAEKGFGLAKASRLKTIIYERRGGDVLAVKHNHFQPKSGLKFYENGNLFARVKSDGTIVEVKEDGTDGSNIDMLATKDEIKIGTGQYNKKSFNVSGASVGLIKIADKEKNKVKRTLQWLNHAVQDVIVDSFANVRVPKMNQKLRNIFSKSIPSRDANGNITKSVSDKMQSLLESLVGRGSEGNSPWAREHIINGAGLHKGLSKITNVVVQSGLVNDILQLDGNLGTYSDIVPNLEGDLNKNEIRMSVENANALIDKFMTDNNIVKTVEKRNAYKTKDGLEEVNAWLAENDIRVFVVRHPVPHIGGAIMPRVVKLHEERGIVEMHQDDVFISLEADNDGDTVSIELLEGEEYNAYKSVIDELDTKPISLEDQFPEDKTKYDMLDFNDRKQLMYQIYAGANAIGELANLQGIYGQLKRGFKSITISGEKIMLRNPDEIMQWPNMKMSDGTAFTGTMDDMLRVNLQAAVDNLKFMLLDRWGYNRGDIIKSMFVKEDGSPLLPGQLDIINQMIAIHKIPMTIRNGKNFEQGNLSLNQAMEQSQKYYEYYRNKEAYIRSLVPDPKKGMGMVTGLELTGKNAPVEMIAIAMYENLLNSNLANLTNRDALNPFEISEDMHKAAHIYAVNKIQDLKDRMYNSYMENLDANVQESIIKKGDVYAETLRGKWNEFINEHKNEGLALDKNNNANAWMDKFDKEFRKLLPFSKVQATYTYLERGFPTYLPPSSKNRANISTLDSTILNAYYKAYNEAVEFDIINQGFDNKLNVRSAQSIMKKYCGGF